MSLLMRDSIDPFAIPLDDLTAVAGYGDGEFIWTPAGWQRFKPPIVSLVIVVSVLHSGDILDVETGDATPAQVPGWVRRFSRLTRRRPTIYCSRETWKEVQAALQAANLGVAAVDWWAATLDGTRDVPGAVAVQYAGAQMTGGNWDESVITDPSWIGLETDMALDPNDPVVVDFRNRLVRLQAYIDPGDQPSGAGETTQRVRDVHFATVGPSSPIQSAIAAIKVELDAVQAAQQGAGGPVDLTKVYAELNALGKHLGVDVATGADT